MTLSYGNKYNGNWKNDKKNGKGTYRWAMGNKYDGEWKEDNEHGNGTLMYSD